MKNQDPYGLKSKAPAIAQNFRNSLHAMQHQYADDARFVAEIDQCLLLLTPPSVEGIDRCIQKLLVIFEQKGI